MTEPRTLTMREVGQRVKALDALRLNADAWLQRARESGDAQDWAKYLEAEREWLRVQRTPYRIAGGEE